VYDVAVTAATRAYMDAMMALPAWQDWSAQAQAEPWTIGKYEVGYPTAGFPVLRQNFVPPHL
jgi:hypothetical protein